MSKTKFGVSVGLMAAAVYLGSIFGGWTIMILLAGYCLLCEEDAWLKKTCVKAVAITVMFALLRNVVGLIPDAFNIISGLLNLLTLNVYFGFINNVCNLVNSVLSFLQTILVIILGYLALNGGTIAVPVVDKLISKYMD